MAVFEVSAASIGAWIQSGYTLPWRLYIPVNGYGHNTTALSINGLDHFNHGPDSLAQCVFAHPQV